MPVKNIARVIVAGLAIMAGLFVYLYEPNLDNTNFEKEVAGENEEPAIRVSTDKLAKGTLAEELTRGSELASWRQAEIYPEITAEVIEVFVSTGDKVEEGDLLARLDGEDYRHEVRAAEPSLQSAQTQYREAEIAYGRMRDEFENIRELFKAGTVSRQELLEMRAQVESAYERLEGAESMIEQSRTQLSAAQRMLERTEVNTPISGTISAVIMERGDMATTQAPLAVVDRLDPLKAELTVDERHINELEVGQEVEVIVGSIREEPFSGEIHEIFPTAVEGARSFPVTVKVDNHQADLRPGMYAEVIFILAEVEEAWLAPQEALVSRNGEDYLFFVENGHAAQYRVEKGMSSQGKVEVSGDFDPKQELITDPPADLEDGEKVRTEDLNVD